MKRNYVLHFLTALALCAIVAALLVPNFIRARSRGSLTACKSNLKNLGTACEMYFTDHDEYPKSASLLTPNYLQTIPECPEAQTDTYSQSYDISWIEADQFRCPSHPKRNQGHPCSDNLWELQSRLNRYSSEKPNSSVTTTGCPVDGVPYEYVSHFLSYSFYCSGKNHSDVSVPKNYPQYNGISGLIER